MRISRMSFGRRVELMRRVRELSRKVEFLEAGDDSGGRMDAGLLRAEIDRMFVLWGLDGVSGLEVDGAEATPEALIERGPEELFREALAAVRAQAGLTEEERKLIVAFHFQMSNQAGWECDACRKAGLEQKRRCGWSPAASSARETVVWARRQSVLTTCPRSYITAESEAMVEEFLVRRRFGGLRFEELSARQVEAFLILDKELSDEQRNTRRAG
jgi:hypothetical protein